MACAAAAVLHPCGGGPLAAHPRRRSAAPGGGQQQSYAERVLVRLREGEPVKVSSELYYCPPHLPQGIVLEL